MTRISQKGFTIIELIVVFTVIGILSTIGTASLVSYSHTQALNRTASDFVQALNTAKSLAATQVKTLDKNGSGPEGCQDGTQSLNGYGVQIVSSANPKYYALYLQCINSNGQKAPITTDAKWQTKLPNDIALTTTITYIYFPVLSGGTIITTPAGNSDSGSVVLTSYGSTKTISLQQGYISIAP